MNAEDCDSLGTLESMTSEPFPFAQSPVLLASAPGVGSLADRCALTDTQRLSPSPSWRTLSQVKSQTEGGYLHYSVMLHCTEHEIACHRDSHEFLSPRDLLFTKSKDLKN